MRIPLSVRSVLVLAAVLGLSWSRADAQIHRQYIWMYDFQFSINLPPGPVEDAVVYVGDEVIWEAFDDLHNTVSVAGNAEQWASELMFRGDTFAYTFTIPGVYNYYCAPHGSDNGDGTADGMRGTVTVLEIPAPGAVGFGAAIGVAAGRRRRRCSVR